MMTGNRENWRNYQRQLQKEAAAGKRMKRMTGYLAAIFLLAAAAFVSYPPSPLIPPPKKKEVDPQPPLLSKTDLNALIDPKTLKNIKKTCFEQISGNKKIFVETTLDAKLQEFALGRLEKASRVKRGSPRYLAMVAMDPVTGKILSMAGFDKGKNGSNPCIESRFPAASIFKIITASAAVEKCGYQPGSKLMFNGGKYTLYKTQLKEKKNRYTNRISFKDSFAQSVNPVFGKIGTLYLGKPVLEKYADAFAFNRRINFEIPVSPSTVSLSDEPYQWAEIACGFNRETLISPLHGALLGSTILNSGTMPEPTIIDQIIDSNGTVIYTGKSATVGRSIKPQTTSVIKKLMATTIRSGTGKKSFRGYQKDPILKNLNIGGKTGSIFNKGHDVRLDWFVGFAEEKKGHGKMAVAVLVGHEEYIGTRAASYARMMIKNYFDQHREANNKSNALLAKTSDKNK